MRWRVSIARQRIPPASRRMRGSRFASARRRRPSVRRWNSPKISPTSIPLWPASSAYSTSKASLPLAVSLVAFPFPLPVDRPTAAASSARRTHLFISVPPTVASIPVPNPLALARIDGRPPLPLARVDRKPPLPFPLSVSLPLPLPLRPPTTRSMRMRAVGTSRSAEPMGRCRRPRSLARAVRSAP